MSSSKTNISFFCTRTFAQRIRIEAALQGKSKSALLREVMEQYLDSVQDWDGEMSAIAGHDALRDMGIIIGG